MEKEVQEVNLFPKFRNSLEEIVRENKEKGISSTVIGTGFHTSFFGLVENKLEELRAYKAYIQSPHADSEIQEFDAIQNKEGWIVTIEDNIFQITHERDEILVIIMDKS